MPVREIVKRQSKSNSFSNRDRVPDQSQNQHSYPPMPSSSSDRRQYSNGFSSDSSSPVNFGGLGDPPPYHHNFNSNPNERSHGAAPPSSYRSDPQSPHRISSSGNYPPNHLSMSNDHRGPSQSSQSGKSAYRSSSEASKIKHKQQRLLLLRHASKCRYEKNCPTTEHCASMKRLWRHIADCKDQTCEVQHCMSSRYVLTHFKNCKDPNCETCGPVRESIRKSHERKKNMKQNSEYDRPYPGSNQSSDYPMQPMPVSSNHGDVFCGEAKDSPLLPQAQPFKRPKIEDGIQQGNELKVGFSPPPPRQHAPLVTSTDMPVMKKPDPAISTTIAPKDTSRDDAMRKRNGMSQIKPDTPTSKKPSDGGAKNVDIPSFINCFTIEQIETHIKSLNRTHQLSPSDLKKRCLEVLKGLQSHAHGWVFNNPVDPEELGLPDYFQIIKHPMDLGTVQKRIENGLYHSVGEFSADVHLTFDNATTYNQEGSVVHNMARELKTKFLNDYSKLLAKLKDEEEQRRKNERACSLCGCEKLLFEPPVFFCNGLNCQSKRIRRNSHFYVGGNSQYYWCNPCFNELDEKTQIELGDLTIKKSDLKKKKNDEVHEESWVQCDACEKWIHQICGLFNARQNKEHGSVYCCPECLIQKRRKEQESGQKVAETKTPMAVDLPRTKLSERLERHVRQKVEEKCVELAKDKAISEVCQYVQLIYILIYKYPVS